MPFDPARYEQIKKSLTPATAGGFDPDRYERVRAQVAAPQPPQARPGRVGRAIDFTRRAFMGDEIAPERRNILQNLFRDVTDITTGTSQLLGQGLVEGGKLARDVTTSLGPAAISSVLGPPSPAQVGQVVRSPLAERIKALPGQISTSLEPEGRKIIGGFAKEVGKDIGRSFGIDKEINKTQVPRLKTAISKFHEHPLFTFIDWTAAGSLVGQAARTGLRLTGKAAQVAGKPAIARGIEEALSTQRKGLPVAPRGEIPRRFSENPLVKFGLEKPFDKVAANEAIQSLVSNSPLLKPIAPPALLTPEARAGRVAEQVGQRAQSEFYMRRNLLMKEAQDKFKSLPEADQRDFIPIIQGRAMPRMQSPKFKEVYDWYKANVLDEQQKFGLTDETVKRVAYQPLIISGGLLTQDDYRLASRGDMAAMAKVKSVTDDFAEARVRVQERAIQDFIGRRRGKPSALAREIAEATAPDPIYFPSIFPDKLKLSDFLPTRFLQRFKPGFMKGRSGAFGFIEKDPASAFAVHQAQVEKFLQNETLINAIKDKFAVPLDKASDLKEGYKVFAPDGYIGFYKGSMPLQEAFIRGVGTGQDIDQAFISAVQKVLPDMAPDNRAFVGVRRHKLYQVPADVADRLTEMLLPLPKVPEPVKLLWDKPLQAFKFSVLAMAPRWVINNTIGNILLTGMGRVSPESFIKAGKRPFRELIPPEVLAGGFRRTEFPQMGRVTIPQAGITEKAVAAVKETQPIKGVIKFGESIFEINAKVEDAFRSATFIDKVTKAATEKITKDTATGIFNMKQGLNKFLQRGDFAESNVAKVAGQMLKDDAFRMSAVGEVNRILNDYTKMSAFERSVVRRIVPFWSWWKFMMTTFWSMPVKDPPMAQAIKLMANAGQEISASEWKANGLDVKEIPTWMAGNVILGILPEDQMMQMLNTRSINPLSTAKEWPGLAPQIQLIFERMTGRRFPFGAPFTSPREKEVSPGVVFRKHGEGVERVEHPTPPPLISHILRQFPQVQIAEALAFPFRTFTGEGIGSNAARAFRGKGVPIKPELRMANILGLPITETDFRRLRKSKREANKAKQQIERQIKQANRLLEQIKLGPQ